MFAYSVVLSEQTLQTAMHAAPEKIADFRAKSLQMDLYYILTVVQLL